MKHKIEGLARRIANRMGYSFERTDPLTQIANRCRTDKGSMYFSAHHYSRWYHQFFKDLRDRPITLLELGLCRVDFNRRRKGNVGRAAGSDRYATVPSLSMWSQYFSRASIFGFDIDDFTDATAGRITVLQGNVSSIADLNRLVDAAGGQFDIVIDDASHLAHHQQLTMGVLFPRLRPGGIYVIEDLHWYGEPSDQITLDTRSVLRNFQYSRGLVSDYIEPQTQKLISDQIERVAFVDSLANTNEDYLDSVAFIFKKMAQDHVT